jgi:abortive infection bacteriophage resistance protein
LHESALSIFFLSVPLPYTKSYLGIEEQIDLLISRGMSVSDRNQAQTWLQRIGYYRLSGYWYPCRKRESSPRPGETILQVKDEFQPDTSLDAAIKLYVFDKRLRLLVLDALERIEVAVRVDIAQLLGKRGTWAHRDAGNFNSEFNKLAKDEPITQHAKWLQYLDKLAERSKEDFAKHFRSKYSDPLPVWVVVEVWDFGTITNVLTGMLGADLQELADRYGIPKKNTFVSWWQTLNHVRNTCAHHGRLWNRPLVIQPAVPNSRELMLHQHWAKDKYSRSRLYVGTAIMQHFLKTIHPSSSWGKRLKDLLDTFPGGPGLSFRSTGFPDNWFSEPLWS